MMKRVICLYRVSTVGQVDHDDIPMQRKACREYAATHPDWEIVDEICEKVCEIAKEGDLIITLGCGDVNKLSKQIAERLAQKNS